jgi:hypothetical protein
MGTRDLLLAHFVAVTPARAAQVRRAPSAVTTLREGNREETGIGHYWLGMQYLLAGALAGPPTAIFTFTRCSSTGSTRARPRPPGPSSTGCRRRPTPTSWRSSPACSAGSGEPPSRRARPRGSWGGRAQPWPVGRGGVDGGQRSGRQRGADVGRRPVGPLHRARAPASGPPRSRPAPREGSPPTAGPRRARYLAPSAVTAPVRMSVIAVASRRARGIPVRGSKRASSAISDGSPWR